MDHGVYITLPPDPYKCLVIPERSQIARMTPFINWFRVAAANAPPSAPPAHLGPGYVATDQATAMGFFATPTCPDLSSPMLMGLNPCELIFLGTFWERLLGYLWDEGVFEEETRDLLEFADKVQSAATRNPNKGQHFSNPFFVTLAEIDATAEPYAWQLHANAPIAPRPAELEFISLISLRDLVTTDPDIPFALVSLLALALHRSKEDVEHTWIA